MLENPAESTSHRRKSMDPVSQVIHLEDLPTPGSRFELQELLGVGTCAKVYAALDKQKDEEPKPRLPDSIARPIAIMPLSRMENTTFVKPSIIDFHDMGLRTVLTVRTPKEQRTFNAYSTAISSLP
ncbi:uncharacterized protein TNCV_4906491 [Trichonephila clavipes]|uniref:Protein kinase domain-containing protein n=1 Tax=Trichonephila clavipes TaxID=2585209 RepID=A0A8X6V854_TRICX|nr:uncharacterized protein TNCV_4906491 [Trichonephila clavipes]